MKQAVQKEKKLTLEQGTTYKTMSHTKPIYRVDKFKVPTPVEAEFLARAMKAQEILRRQPGLIEAHLLKKSGGPGSFNLLSLAIWQNAGSIAATRDVMTACQKSKNIDPDEFRAQMHIEVDTATYEEVSA